jgi:hypothetical protein
MTRKDRRRTNRYPAGWIARYSSDSPGGWSRCDVVDVSEAGAGLVLSGPPVETGTRLTLELHANDGDPVGRQVQGIVRHVLMSPDGTMHIGVEFAPDQEGIVVLKVTNELAVLLAEV